MTMTKFPTPEIAAGVDALIRKANEVMKANHTRMKLTHCLPDTLEVDSVGPSFARLVTVHWNKDGTRSDRGRSVHSFVAMRDGKTKELGEYKEGQIFMAAGFHKPAKHARGCIWTDLSKVGPYGMEYLR